MPMMHNDADNRIQGLSDSTVGQHDDNDGKRVPEDSWQHQRMGE
jgi:hypothetical protein